MSTSRAYAQGERPTSWQYLKKTRGITKEKWFELFDAQNGKCPICLRNMVREHPQSRAIIDHAHNTNKFRGMICSACNVGLGMFMDNIHSLAGAIAYLAKFNMSTEVESS